jgi:sterol desaturase/sphingolipid hydroxylase (fatty acid hydroxylase superfamily)
MVNENLIATLIETSRFWGMVWFFDSARYVFGAGLVSIVLFVIFKKFSARRKIQKRHATPSDIKREVVFSLITTAVYATVALLTVKMKDAGVITIYNDWSKYGLVYGAFSLPIILVLHDAYFYWVHRMMHHRRLYKTFHLLHHRSRTPTPWAAYAFAPGEAFLMALYMPLVTYLLPMHVTVVGAFLTIMIVRNAMGHSGIEFHPKAWVDSPFDMFTTTTHHDLHHQRTRGNFGLYFTWWDRLMGTEFKDYKERFREAATPRASSEVDGVATTSHSALSGRFERG